MSSGVRNKDKLNPVLFVFVVRFIYIVKIDKLICTAKSNRPNASNSLHRRLTYIVRSYSPGAPPQLISGFLGSGGSACLLNGAAFRSVQPFCSDHGRDQHRYGDRVCAASWRAYSSGSHLYAVRAMRAKNVRCIAMLQWRRPSMRAYAYTPLIRQVIVQQIAPVEFEDCVYNVNLNLCMPRARIRYQRSVSFSNFLALNSL